VFGVHFVAHFIAPPQMADLSTIGAFLRSAQESVKRAEQEPTSQIAHLYGLEAVLRVTQDLVQELRARAEEGQVHEAEDAPPMYIE
jgi:hypothetical protein